MSFNLISEPSLQDKNCGSYGRFSAAGADSTILRKRLLNLKNQEETARAVLAQNVKKVYLEAEYRQDIAGLDS